MTTATSGNRGMATQAQQALTRDELVTRMVRADELQVSGENPDELATYFRHRRLPLPRTGRLRVGLRRPIGVLRLGPRRLRRPVDPPLLHRRGGDHLACQTWIESTLAREFTSSPAGPLPPNGNLITFDLINIFSFDPESRMMTSSWAPTTADASRELGADGRERPWGLRWLLASSASAAM